MEKRKIELFVAGCPCCDEAVTLVKKLACPSCDLLILDMRSDREAQKKAKDYRVRSAPSVVIDGKLAPCCAGAGVNEASLSAVGVGCRWDKRRDVLDDPSAHLETRD